MPDTDYYPEPESDSAANEPSEDSKQTTESPSTETTLIPKSMLGDDCKVGGEITLEIVHEYEDEIEVKCCKSDKGKTAMSEAGDSLGKLSMGN